GRPRSGRGFPRRPPTARQAGNRGGRENRAAPETRNPSQIENFCDPPPKARRRTPPSRILAPHSSHRGIIHGICICCSGLLEITLRYSGERGMSTFLHRAAAVLLLVGLSGVVCAQSFTENF